MSVATDEAARLRALETLDEHRQRVAGAGAGKIETVARRAVKTLKLPGVGPENEALERILDDPFAHYDRRRLRLGLAVVADVEQERQVVVFSEDRDLVDEARALCAICKVIELPSPT